MKVARYNFSVLCDLLFESIFVGVLASDLKGPTDARKRIPTGSGRQRAFPGPPMLGSTGIGLGWKTSG
jgi:hypothetical protein